MKNGDVVLNIDNRIKVEFQGYIAGRVNGYIIHTETGWEAFKGTIEEVLVHVADKVVAHNNHAVAFGGRII